MGLALYWPFFRHYDFVAFFSSGRPADVFLWPAYSIILGTVAALLIAAALGCRRLEPKLLRLRKTLVLLGLAGTLGYALLLVAPLPPEPSATLLQIVGSLGIATGYAALTLGWMKLLVIIDRSTSLVCMLAACCVSSVISLATSLHPLAAAAVTTAAPLASGLIWALASRDVSGYPVLYGLDRDQGVPLAFLAASGLFLAFGRVAQGLFYSDRAQVPYVDRVAGVVMTVALLALGAALMRTQGPWRVLRIGWAFLAVVFVAGLMLLVPLGFGLEPWGLGIVSASLSCFELLFWMLLIEVVHQKRLSAVAVMGMGVVLFRVVPAFVGKIVIPRVTAFGDSVGPELVGPVLLGMTFCLVCATVVGLCAESLGHKETQPNQVPPQEEAPSDACGPRAERLQALAEQGRLTPREAEVLRYMAQGYSYKKIADCIGVTLGTAQGYAKNVFKKLDVHTRQELIDATR